MRKKAFLCVDIGSSFIKCAVSSYHGKNYKFYSIRNTHGGPNVIDALFSLSNRIEEDIHTFRDKGGFDVDALFLIINPFYVRSIEKDFF